MTRTEAPPSEKPQGRGKWDSACAPPRGGGTLPPVPRLHALLPHALVASLCLLACSRVGANLKTLTVDEVAARVAAHDGKTFVFDDNPHDRFAKGHVPGAHWVAASEPTAAELPADKGALLVFYCASEL